MPYEPMLTAFVVFVFLLSSIQAIVFLAGRDEYFSRALANVQSSVAPLRQARAVLRETSSAFFLDSGTVTRKDVQSSLHYLDKALQEFFLKEVSVESDLRTEIKSRVGTLQEDLGKNGAITRKDLGRSFNDLDYLIRKAESSYTETRQNEISRTLKEQDRFLILSLITMCGSGIGLIVLLLLKLRNLQVVRGQRDQAVDTLVSRMVAIESAKDGVAIIDPAGKLSYANNVFQKLYGYDSLESIQGKDWHDLYDQLEREWLEAETFVPLMTSGHWHGNSVGLRRDGSTFHEDLSITQMQDGGRVFIIRDNTEEMESADLSGKRLAAIEAAGDGIGLVDANGNLIYINRALMALHGIDTIHVDDYIGKSWTGLYTSKGKEEVKNKVLPLLYERGYWKGDSPIVRQDGSVIYAEMSLTLLPDGGFIGTARDISDRKKAEEEKETLQNQFFQAQKMEAIGRLAGGIAHDFNNILASIMGYTEFLLEDLDEKSKQHHFARQIMHGTTRAGTLVEQILSFSRRRDATQTPIGLARIIKETVSLLRATTPPTIALDTQFDDEDAVISGNPTQISQTIMNLCVNARDAMTDDKGVLSVKLHNYYGADLPCQDMMAEGEIDPSAPARVSMKSLPGGRTRLTVGNLECGKSYACLSVSDTGCGMDRETMERIFEPFFTTKAVDKGTGLGLATVHGIVLGHRGAIIVTSKPGSGTTFDIYFPILEEEKKANESAMKIQSAERGTGRILIVEDQASVRDMTTQRLSRIGYESHACVSGDEALAHLRENPGHYDLVLSDYSMPKMSGVELAEHIRNEFPDLPLLLITGFDQGKLELAMEQNPVIKGVLRKPVDSEKLSDAIRDVLARARQAA